MRAEIKKRQGNRDHGILAVYYRAQEKALAKELYGRLRNLYFFISLTEWDKCIDGDRYFFSFSTECLTIKDIRDFYRSQKQAALSSV